MSSDLSRVVGRRVRVLRLALGESLTDLGDVLDVTHAQVSRLEQGTTEWNVAKLDAAAAHYSVPTFVLVADKPDALKPVYAELVSALDNATSEAPSPHALQRVAAAWLPFLTGKQGLR